MSEELAHAPLTLDRCEQGAEDAPVSIEGEEANTEGGEFDEEQLLVQAAKSGDSEARGVLLTRYEDLVRGYLRKRMGDKLTRYVSVDDLLQEVLLRGAQAIEKLRPGARGEDLRGLLLKHAQWVLSVRGRRSGGFVGESVLQEGPTPSSGTVSPVLDLPEPAPSMGPVSKSDRNHWLKQLAKRLDEKYAAVLGLYLNGKTYREIAEELQITEETARKRFMRAASKLKDMADPESE